MTLLATVFVLLIEPTSLKASVFSPPQAISVLKNRAQIVVNGTFYCTKRLIPVGMLKSDGKKLAEGALQWGFVILDGRPQIVKLNADIARRATFIVAGFPLLINGRDLHRQTDLSLTERARRTAICINSRGEVFFVVVSHKVTLKQLTQICRAHGAVSALNLDGGGSVNLAVNGHVKVAGRALTNALLAKLKVTANGKMKATKIHRKE